jgi:addiction module RelE/StbE family toxin
MDSKIKKAYEEKLSWFLQDEFDIRLRNHALRGKYKQIRSIAITGDVRAHYEIREEGVRYFVAIGTHSELYENL